MVKIIDKINAKLKDDQKFFSFEYFPPRTDAGSANLLSRIDRMGQMEPLFVDITWGAGGSTAERTMNICTGTQNYLHMETMMHLTCTNQSVEDVRATLEKAKKENIQNILALRGDAPHNSNGDWKARDTRLQFGSDLVRIIREEYGDFFGICVAGYPYGHPESVSYEEDLKYLKEKVDAGADFIITQLFFKAEDFLKYEKDCRDIGITCPIIPGIFPIQNYASLRALTKMASIDIPEDIRNDIEKCKNDDAAIRDYGIVKTVEMVTALHRAGVKGVHFYTLNREVAVQRILQELSLIQPSPRHLPWKASIVSKRKSEDVRPIFWANRQKSYIQRTDSWDEFPNGRWGDANSPAFGDLDDYHLFTLDNKGTPEELQPLWGGSPTSLQDIHSTFARYVKGEIDKLPWIDDPLALETQEIVDQLVRLNLHGFMTINSQPRVNGAPSDDPAVGWGPKNGFVYQKAYVEFFCSPDLLERLISKMKSFPSLQYHAVTCKGNDNTNAAAVTAVTWGVFPAKEIIQPTVVDPAAFMVWKDEAFRLWTSKWGHIYKEESESRALIDRIRETYYLVNIVDNNYISGDIWKIFNDIIAELDAEGCPHDLTPPTPLTCEPKKKKAGDDEKMTSVKKTAAAAPASS